MPRTRDLLLATRNAHKLREFARLLEPAGITVTPLPGEIELPPEDGSTFAENALPKARTAALQTGRTAIADDSGIEAEALGGAPGVRSARYAGPSATDQANLEKLSREAPAGSALRYVCVIAYVDPVNGEERLFHGECRGRLASAARGSRGFGYDPAFVPEGETHDRTMAELSDQEKDAISHRGRAARALAGWLRSRQAGPSAGGAQRAREAGTPVREP
jgi:XTP/dITP diphosphohydrolase